MSTDGTIRMPDGRELPLQLGGDEPVIGDEETTTDPDVVVVEPEPEPTEVVEVLTPYTVAEWLAMPENVARREVADREREWAAERLMAGLRAMPEPELQDGDRLGLLLDMHRALAGPEPDWAALDAEADHIDSTEGPGWVTFPIDRSGFPSMEVDLVELNDSIAAEVARGFWRGARAGALAAVLVGVGWAIADRLVNPWR